MDLKAKINDMVNENLKLITTDRDLQKFMVGAFSLLVIIILFCSYYGDFHQAEQYYDIADKLLSGTFGYDELGTDLTPVTLLLLIPPRLFSMNSTMYCYLFSLYGFAFYMLGGHFMLKSCRETGFSQRKAYILLFIAFFCSFSFMTLSTGSITPAFVIIGLWFYHVKNYKLSFMSLALATMSGLYPCILFAGILIHMCRTSKIRQGYVGITLYILICCIFLLFSMMDRLSDLSEISIPFLKAPATISAQSIMGTVYEYAGFEDPKEIWYTSLACGWISALAIAITLKKQESGMGPVANALGIGLILTVALIPQYSEMYYIWIAMLLPMTQMFNEPECKKTTLWTSFLAFSVTTMLCDMVLSSGSGMFECVSLIRAASLFILMIALVKDSIEHHIGETTESDGPTAE